MINIKYKNVLDNDYEVIEEKECVKIIKNKLDGIYECLKVINTSKLNEAVIKDVLSKIERVNNENCVNLIKYTKLVLLENTLYRLMPYVSINLRDINPVEYFEDMGSYNVLYGICNGLKSLHMMNLYHGDLKPSNVFLTEENEIILSDYLNNELYIGKNGEKDIGRCDNLCFISYEEMRSEEVSKESDIWSFGCIFYYVLSGKFLFKSKSIVETTKNIEKCKYEKLECDFAYDLNGLLNKLIVKDKEKRISIDEVLNEVNRINEIVYLHVFKEEEEEENVGYLDDIIKEKIDVLLSEVEKNKSTKLDLNISDNRVILRETSALYLNKRLRLYPFITILELESNKIGDNGFKHICRSLQYLQELKELNVGSNSITSIGMNYFKENIQFIPKLEKIDISSNRIGKEGIEILSEILHLTPNMKCLRLRYCLIGDGGFKDVCESFKYIPELKELDVGSNTITLIGINYFKDDAQFIRQLEKLDLQGNKIRKEGIEVLSDVFCTLSNLKWLSFYDCDIGDSGFNTFSSHLKDIKKLEYLNISMNGITDFGLTVFGNNIQYITELRELELVGNNLSEIGGRLLSKYLPKCKRINKLHLLYNKLSNNKDIKRIIKENHPNKRLDVSI